MIDRSGMKITGSMFGESALQFHDEKIHVDSVYKISQGQIR
jgi:hypothetical protein